MTTIVHVVNQFFAGLGGEDKAGMPVGVIEGSAGAARGLQLQLGADAKIACTIYYGDNYFHEHKEDAIKAILDAVRSAQPQTLVAGPAFNSGRYGVSCVEVCNAIANELEISCVTAMHEDNPGIGTYLGFANSRVYCLPTAETAAGMTDALKRLAKFAVRLAHGETVGSAQREGYIARGIRRLEQTDRPGAERAIEMLLKKIKNEPFESELPMEVWDDAHTGAAASARRGSQDRLGDDERRRPLGQPGSFQDLPQYSLAKIQYCRAQRARARKVGDGSWRL